MHSSNHKGCSNSTSQVPMGACCWLWLPSLQPWCLQPRCWRRGVAASTRCRCRVPTTQDQRRLLLYGPLPPLRRPRRREPSGHGGGSGGGCCGDDGSGGGGRRRPLHSPRRDSASCRRRRRGPWCGCSARRRGGGHSCCGSWQEGCLIPHHTKWQPRRFWQYSMHLIRHLGRSLDQWRCGVLLHRRRH